MTFPRSFLVLKLVLLGVFLAAHFLPFARTRSLKIYPSVLLFYCSVAMAGILWSVIGMLGGSELAGVLDSLRLYVAWSGAFLVIVTLLRANGGLIAFHRAAVISAFLIALINIAGLADYYLETGYLTEAIRDELSLRVGIHEGYVQITSHNIGSLFFLVPYLIASQVRRDMQHSMLFPERLALFLCLLVVALSGRRALWITVCVSPLIALMLAATTGSVWDLNTQRMRRIFYAAGLAGIVLGWFLLSTQLADGLGFLTHLNEAFSSEDERSIQLGYLWDAFMDAPALGSGFGAGAGYIRSEERPWLYELTYFQLLFNCGLIGAGYFLSILGIYFKAAAAVTRARTNVSGHAFCLLVGFFSFLVGTYSNPYLGSFDFLLYIAVLPLVASYSAGQIAGGPEPAARAVATTKARMSHSRLWPGTAS